MNIPGRTWAEIDLSALAENFAAIKEYCGLSVYAVVKADAYGHGALPCAKVLEKAGAAGFCVSNPAEADQLRSGGIALPVLILGYTPPEYAASLAENQISQCVYSLEYAQALNAAAERAGVCVDVHLKLDTGMGRIGFDCRENTLLGALQAKAVFSMKNLRCTGVFTHFAVADTPDQAAFTADQYRRFAESVLLLEAEGHRFEVKHCSNSAGALTLQDTFADAVRAGIALYGLTPDAAMTLPVTLKPVMALYSTVSMVKTLEAGQSVSYGRTYTAEETRRIATVTAGYADGVPRLLSNCGCVLIRGKRAPIVGRVCMDQFCVDVTDIPDVQMGDPVTVFGPGLPVDEVAEHAGTIHYEIVCDISRRVPRIYKGAEA